MLAVRRVRGHEIGDIAHDKNFTWAGWCSMATEKTVFYLDNVQVKNE